MARYNWAVISGEAKEASVKNGEKSNKLLWGALIVGAVGTVIWWKWDENNREKAAIRRIEGKGDPELYRLLEEENMRLGIK